MVCHLSAAVIGMATINDLVGVNVPAHRRGDSAL